MYMKFSLPTTALTFVVTDARSTRLNGCRSLHVVWALGAFVGKVSVRGWIERGMRAGTKMPRVYIPQIYLSSTPNSHFTITDTVLTRTERSSVYPLLSQRPSFENLYSPLTSFLGGDIVVQEISMASILKNSNALRKALWTGNGLSFGAWQMLPGTHLSRTIARSGFDWVCIDCEHGNIAGKYDQPGIHAR